eukprot:scaffold27785_cov81-Phaeocystis_antarctica.AAC.1
MAAADEVLVGRWSPISCTNISSTRPLCRGSSLRRHVKFAAHSIVTIRFMYFSPFLPDSCGGRRRPPGRLMTA